MKRKRKAQLYLSTISLHGKDGGSSGLQARIVLEAIGSMGLGVVKFTKAQVTHCLVNGISETETN